MQYSIHTDGGSRGNPGPAAVGVCVLDGEKVLHEIATTIGVATNNEAEYQALLHSLSWVTQNQDGVQSIAWKLDSKLIVEQVQGHWKIKEARLQSLAQECRALLAQVTVPYTISYVPRAQNACADALVNQALDAAQE